MTNYAIWSLVKPSHLLLYALVLGTLLAGRPLGRRLLAGSVAALAACAVLPVAAIVLGPLEQRFARPADPGPVDGIIVLAGAELPGLSRFHGQPQLDANADRLTEFLALARRYPDARLVHNGAGTQRAPSASDVARQVLLGAGIDPARILFEDVSRNTCDGARRARERAAPQASERWLLVTSASHVPRSVACFRAAGWDVTPWPVDYRIGAPEFEPNLAENLVLIDMAAHEWLGLGWYRLRGATREWYPAP